MEEEAFLPEEVLVLILTLLPLKSLLRFACVSKRFRLIILYDPKFSKSQLESAREHKTLNHRVLLLWNAESPQPHHQLESLDLNTPVFGDPSSVRKLTLPFGPPGCRSVLPLASANGIVFLAFNCKLFYMWNPATGFFRQLPDLDMPENIGVLSHYGVGYFPATDDYKLFVSAIDARGTRETAVFSMRSKVLKKLQVSLGSYLAYLAYIRSEGTFLNEALHWLDGDGKIIAFDLAGEEEEMMLRKMPMPILNYRRDYKHSDYLGVSAGGFLSLTCCNAVGCIDVWVMNEYGVCSSWTKLYKSKFPDLPHLTWYYACVLILDTSMVAEYTDREVRGLTRINHKERKHDKYVVLDGGEHGIIHIIQYQETLIQID